jgi:hypothetical protein
MKVKATVACLSIAISAIGTVSASGDEDASNYLQWPISLNDVSTKNAIGAISNSIKGEDLESGLAAYRSIVSMGTALSAWNAQFKSFGIDQAIAMRIEYAGVESGHVVPLIQGINLGYQFLPSEQADANAKVLLFGASALDSGFGKYLAGALSAKLGRQVSIPDWNDRGDFVALRSMQQQLLGNNKPTGLPITTKLSAEGNTNLQPYMPFAENPYFDVRNIFFGPGSQFEKHVGQAAIGSRSDDGRIVMDPGKVQVDPKAFSEAGRQSGADDPKKAGVDAAKCITKCMEAAGAGLGGQAAKDVLYSKQNPGKAAGWAGVASGLALTACTLVVCKDDVKKVETLKEQQKKAEQEIKKEDDKRKEEEKKADDQAKKEEPKKQEPKKQEPGSAGANKRCRQDVAESCNDDVFDFKRCEKNPRGRGCEVFTFLKNRCRGLSCGLEIPTSAPSGPTKRPIITSTDDKIGLQDRQQQVVLAQQFYSLIAAEISQLPTEALRSSILDDERITQLKTILAQPDIATQLEPRVRNEMLFMLVRTR